MCTCNYNSWSDSNHTGIPHHSTSLQSLTQHHLNCTCNYHCWSDSNHIGIPHHSTSLQSLTQHHLNCTCNYKSWSDSSTKVKSRLPPKDGGRRSRPKRRDNIFRLDFLVLLCQPVPPKRETKEQETCKRSAASSHQKISISNNLQQSTPLSNHSRSITYCTCNYHCWSDSSITAQSGNFPPTRGVRWRGYPERSRRVGYFWAKSKNWPSVYIPAVVSGQKAIRTLQAQRRNTFNNKSGPHNLKYSTSH
jgi:hypothetical protein